VFRISVCANPIRGEIVRFTLLDACGVPVTGDGSAQVTTDAWTEITITPNYEDGTRLLQLKANGEPCVNEQGPSFLNWIDEVTNLCTLDVDLIALVFGEDPIVSTAEADFVGVQFGTGLLNARFSKEIWQPVAGEDSCDAEGNQRWVYWAFPHEYNARVQELTFTNDVFTFGFASMSKPASPLWDIGDPWLSDSPVSTWGPGKHFAFAITTVQPPEPACGAVEIFS
jgi:hypothetical protein